MKMVEFRVVVRCPTELLSDTEMESLSELLSDLDIEQKVYGSIRELIRECIDSKYNLDVEVI